MYFRYLTTSYTFRIKEEPTSDIDNFNKNLAGIQQNTFPEDEIDKLILQAVRTDYPESKVINKSTYSTDDQEYLNCRKTNPQTQALISILPEINHSDPSKWFLYQGLEIFTRELTIYIDWANSSLFNNEAFDLYYDISFESGIKDLMEKFCQVVKPI